jgi:hypothetical protein
MVQLQEEEFEIRTALVESCFPAIFAEIMCSYHAFTEQCPSFDDARQVAYIE